MASLLIVIVSSVCSFAFFDEVAGHGRLMKPPQRSTMWRFGYNVPRNYNDNGLNCGGTANAQAIEQGKCLCGDYPFTSVQPNNGGMYDTGLLAETYTSGGTIDIRVELTANHLGYFQFRLCDRESFTQVLTKSCLDQNLLRIAGTQNTDYKPGSRSGNHYLRLQLPAGVTCSHCVIQWTYTAGNSHGCDSNGKCCLGCGRQEQFINCADVAVIGTGGMTQAPTAGSATPVAPPPTPAPNTATPSMCHCYGRGYWSGNLDYWCRENCKRGFCPESVCWCHCVATSRPPQICRASNSYKLVAGMDNWCLYYCEQYSSCPNERCACN